MFISIYENGIYYGDMRLLQSYETIRLIDTSTFLIHRKCHEQSEVDRGH